MSKNKRLEQMQQNLTEPVYGIDLDFGVAINGLVVIYQYRTDSHALEILKENNLLYGIDGKSIKGDKGDRGLDGIGIDKVSFKDNTITITLTDGSKKDFKLPVQFVGGGGGIGENRVREIIAQSGTSTDLQNRAEIESLYKVAYSTSYSEFTYNLGNIEAINIWDTSLKGTLLFTKSLTYVEGNITQIDITDHLQNKTLTKELSYNNGNIISINKTIS